MMDSLEESDLRFTFRGGSVVSRRVVIAVSMAASSSGVALSAGSYSASARMRLEG